MAIWVTEVDRGAFRVFSDDRGESVEALTKVLPWDAAVAARGAISLKRAEITARKRAENGRRNLERMRAKRLEADDPFGGEDA